MSRLQAALGAYPPGTRVTRQMMATDKEHRRLMDQEWARYADTARWIMREKGCTWGEALRMLRDGEADNA